MEEHKKYLADQILSEEKIVTYRSLSRALKTHVNTAKGMLYEFHRSQNAMRPGIIHATYLIYGIQKVEKVEEDGDVEMTSSPPDVEPLMEEVVTHSLTLVPGDRLKEVLATYEEVSAFHIYSLARHPIREPQMLADVSQQIREQTNDDSSSLATYGSIANPNVRKRDRKGRPPVAAPAAAVSAAKPAAKPAVKKEPAPSTKPAAAEAKSTEKTTKESKPAPAKESPFSKAASNKATPPLKKSGSSGIMSSFAKAAAKAASKPKEAPKKVEAPEAPALSDDGEDDDENIPAAKQSADTGRKSRKEREAELKRMMEESDEEEDDEPEEKEEPEDEPMEEAPEPEPETKAAPEPADVVASSGDGRKRGKRKVMKKKQVMDEDGYLVTIQEAVWEEFSEDEAPPPAPKPKPSSAPNSGSQGTKAKKAAPKGQGNIMSFFSKK
ncbi:DNA polymerase subunit cdc27 [Colletotrichum musicola]|uniref:DNA polymerase delta subunit 3 n=1 Tax=Colletotrichum musicola TaxID=2175873 RepID=A0A8H6KEA9_9PEZI|nr:DNA polymerase subunit cdc27 [Colletotrichum musicola]